MKRSLHLAVVFTLVAFMYTSCSSNNSEDATTQHSTEEGLSGKYFVRLDDKVSLYFINESEVIVSVAYSDSYNDYEKYNHTYVKSYKQNYNQSGEKLLIKDNEDGTDKAYQIYNGNMIMKFNVENGKTLKEGVAFKLTEIK